MNTKKKMMMEEDVLASSSSCSSRKIVKNIAIIISKYIFLTKVKSYISVIFIISYFIYSRTAKKMEKPKMKKKKITINN
jgi:hypothetical protein